MHSTHSLVARNINSSKLSAPVIWHLSGHSTPNNRMWMDVRLKISQTFARQTQFTLLKFQISAHWELSIQRLWRFTENQQQILKKTSENEIFFPKTYSHDAITTFSEPSLFRAAPIISSLLLWHRLKRIARRNLQQLMQFHSPPVAACVPRDMGTKSIFTQQRAQRAIKTVAAKNTSTNTLLALIWSPLIQVRNTALTCLSRICLFGTVICAVQQMCNALHHKYVYTF